MECTWISFDGEITISQSTSYLCPPAPFLQTEHFHRPSAPIVGAWKLQRGLQILLEEKIVRKYKIGKTKIKLDLKVNANKMNFKEHFLAEELCTLL